jgi:hypothetical protein
MSKAIRTFYKLRMALKSASTLFAKAWCVLAPAKRLIINNGLQSSALTLQTGFGLRTCFVGSRFSCQAPFISGRVLP